MRDGQKQKNLVGAEELEKDVTNHNISAKLTPGIRYYTRRQLSKALNVTYQTIRNRMDAGEYPHAVLAQGIYGETWYVPENDVPELNKAPISVAQDKDVNLEDIKKELHEILSVAITEQTGKILKELQRRSEQSGQANQYLRVHLKQLETQLTEQAKRLIEQEKQFQLIQIHWGEEQRKWEATVEEQNRNLITEFHALLNQKQPGFWNKLFHHKKNYQ